MLKGRFAGWIRLGPIEEARASVPQYDGLIAGSPESVREELRDLESLELGEVIVWMNFGGLPLDRVRQSMCRFAERVLPSLRAEATVALQEAP